MRQIKNSCVTVRDDETSTARRKYFSLRELSRLEIVLLTVASTLCFTAVILFQHRFHRIQATIFLGMLSVLALVHIAFTLWTYLHVLQEKRGKKQSLHIFVVDLATSFIGAILLEFFTIVGTKTDTPFLLSDWSKKRILIFFWLCAVMLVFIRYVLTTKSCRYGQTDVRSYITSPVGILIAFCIFIGLFSRIFIFLSQGKLENGVRIVYFCGILALGIFTLFLLKHFRALHIYSSFAVVALAFGTFLSFACPPCVGVSWDDETHYSRAAGLSYLGAGEYTQAEAEYAFQLWKMGGKNFDAELDVPRLNEEYEYAEENGAYSNFPGPVTVGYNNTLIHISIIGALPSAFGLWFARLMFLPLNLQFIFGRWFNLIFYVIVMAFAIRITPIKKVALAVIALLPTSLFLAANYSYDSWVIALIFLAIAIFLREAYHKENPLTIGKLIAIFLLFGLGLCPKAIYFPLAFILFLMPRAKFSRILTRKNYNFTVIVFLILCASSVLMPMIFPDVGSDGDSRGGDVSASGQLAFIKNNPVQFGTILMRFMLRYLSPVTTNSYSMHFAYLGQLNVKVPFLSTVPFIVLIVTIFLDRCNYLPYPVLRFGRVLLAIDILGIIAMIATALYIDFTPVGLHTVRGVQARYLLPLLFPVALLASSNMVKTHYQGKLATIVISLFAALNTLMAVNLVLFV